MKNKLYSFAFLSTLVIGLVSCGSKEHIHTYDLKNPKWTWNEEVAGGYNASVTLTCSGCKEETKDHSITLDAVVTSQTVDPKCETDGRITYTASVEYKGNPLSDTKVDAIDKLGHDFSTLTVSGQYSKTYKALDQFDTKNLVVTATCGRTGCGKSQILKENEYFVIYQTSGADCLYAGDTKVVISAGKARTEINGLTVTKIPNKIEGMEDSYLTSCFSAPDLSGVTSLASNLETKYYSDAECTAEVDVQNLKAGSYYIKATSGDQNYENVSKVATLTVSHSFDESVIGTSYLYKNATKFADALYYKSCKCGQASSSIEDLFAGEDTKLPDTVAASAVESYETVDMVAPEGYKTVTKSKVTYNDQNQGIPFIANLFTQPIEKDINFMMYTKNRGFCGSDWSESTILEKETWYPVTISKNSDSTYDCVVRDNAGTIKIAYRGKSSISEALPYYNIDGSAANMEFYSTEVYGVRAKDETFGDFVSSSSVSLFETVEMMSPKGFQTVTKGKVTYNDQKQGWPFMADISLDRFESASFAFKTENRKFCNKGWVTTCAIGEWYICNVTRNQNGTFDCEIVTTTGELKFGYSNTASFRDSLLYYNYDGDKPELVWYSTEVRGVARNVESPKTSLINDCVICANGAVVEPCSEAIPEGFTKVGKWETDSDFMHGMLYSGTDLRNYSSVSFAIKTTGYFIFDGWATNVADVLWTFITLTQNDDNTWNMVATNIKGEQIYSTTNLSAYKGADPGVYGNYALNTILYGNCSVGYIPSKNNITKLVVYATDFRGILK